MIYLWYFIITIQLSIAAFDAYTGRWGWLLLWDLPWIGLSYWFLQSERQRRAKEASDVPAP